MFNTYHIGPRSMHVSQHSTSEVTEKRAPTDESVRLLREMEAAARQNVLDTIPIGNTNLDLKLLIEGKCGGMEMSLTLLIKINGQSHRCQLSDLADFRFMSREEKITSLKTAVSKELAVLFLTELACTPGSENSLKRLFGGQS